MINRKTTTMLRLAAASVVIALVAPASAQESYPSRPVTFVVPYPAGAPGDVVARKIAEGMNGPLGGTIVIINKPGAGGTIGATEVARAKPDGYTILASISDPVVAQVALKKSLPYDPAKDFAFITKLTESRAAMIAGPSVKARTLQEFVAEAKAKPDGMAYGSFGVGSFPHIIMETIAKRSGAKLVNVNYNGAPPAIHALVNGQIGATFGAAAATKYIQEGKVRILAQAGEKRGLMHDVPTFAEAGFDDVYLRTPLWLGLMAPQGTPKPIVDKLFAAAKASLARKDVQDFIASLAFEPAGSESPEAFEKQFRAEYEAIPAAIRALGIEAN